MISFFNLKKLLVRRICFIFFLLFSIYTKIIVAQPSKDSVNFGNAFHSRYLFSTDIIKNKLSIGVRWDLVNLGRARIINDLESVFNYDSSTFSPQTGRNFGFSSATSFGLYFYFPIINNNVSVYFNPFGIEYSTRTATLNLGYISENVRSQFISYGIAFPYIFQTNRDKFIKLMYIENRIYRSTINSSIISTNQSNFPQNDISYEGYYGGAFSFGIQWNLPDRLYSVNLGYRYTSDGFLINNASTNSPYGLIPKFSRSELTCSINFGLRP